MAQQTTALDRTLETIISRTTREIAQAVRQSIADEVSRVIRGGAVARVSVARAAATPARRVIRCPVPGCGKPGGGPKWGWFCAEHKDLPESQKAEYRQARKSGAVGDGARKAKSAKPGGTKRPMECPFPNCANPSKGPRFSWFCAEHRDLPKAERQKILTAWRKQKEAAKASAGDSESSKPAAKPGKRARKGKAGAKAAS